MMKKLLAIDVDGVLADFITPYSKLRIQKKNGTDFWQNPPYDFWRGLDTLVTAKTFLGAVEGFSVVFITNCPNPTARKDWLVAHGFWKEEFALICNPPRTPKTELLRMLRPYAFIDDSLNNIEDAQSVGVGRTFLFDTDLPMLSWEQIRYSLHEGLEEE